MISKPKVGSVRCLYVCVIHHKHISAYGLAKVIIYKSRGEISLLMQPKIQCVFLAYFDPKKSGNLLNSYFCRKWASTEKKLVVNSEQLLRAVFSCFHIQKIFFF